MTPEEQNARLADAAAAFICILLAAVLIGVIVLSFYQGY